MLSDGDEFDADTLVWTAGVKANPVLAASDLPLDDKGRVKAARRPRVDGRSRTSGLPATTPRCPTSRTPASSARRARSTPCARRRCSADNIVRSLRGEPLKDYRHKHVGSVASLGLHKGVAQVYGVKLRGFPAWFMHRTYHMSRMPTFNRKVRVVLDWTLALFFRRDVVSLGSLHHPREDFDRANQ